MPDSFDHQSSSTRIVRLEAHAAVRLSDVMEEAYDCYDLPVDTHHGSCGDGKSFGKRIKTLASLLTMRINPAFQECRVAVVDTMQGLVMEICSVSPAKGQSRNGGSNNIVYAAPLMTLLDVSTDSVIEKDNVVFKQLPNSFSPASTNSSFVKPVAKATTSTKGEIISTLFSAYGDIGLNLTFKASRELAPSSKPLTKVVLRFVSTTERNTWVSFFMEAYVGLLLDSIRSGEEGICLPAAVAMAADAARGKGRVKAPPSLNPTTDEVKAPPREAVEKYVDFFLGSSGKGSSGGGAGGGGSGGERYHASADVDGAWVGAEAADPPQGGMLKVSERGNHHAHRRRLARERWTPESGGSEADGVQPRGIDCLSIRKTKSSHIIKKGSLEELLLPLDTFSVYAEDDEVGESFCLEVRAPRFSLGSGGDVGPELRLPFLHRIEGNSLAKLQTALASLELEESRSSVGGRGPGAACLTLELSTESFADRKQWLRWFESALGKQILYLNRARLEAAADRAAIAKNKSRFLGRNTDW